MADAEKTIDTVTLTINGKEVTVPKGTSVFEAAEQAEVYIPHYCYHKDLSVAGVCRMCMIEVENMPRLQISCNTLAADGMVVRTDTDKVKTSVKNTLELHLINHPLDCPICDKAGECKLQDYYADYGLYSSRMEYEKVHKPKVVDIGTIMLDSERCILCSRCVRFTDEVTDSHELGIFNRGDHSELRTFDGGPLTNDYTGNLADICPVGALTAKDFRFKCRVWFLEKEESICTMCARGCNTQVSVNPQTQKLYRVEPRRNPDVNKSWICDQGRWDIHYVSDDSRLQNPLKHQDGILGESSWNTAFSDLRERLNESPERVFIGLSTQMLNEEVWVTVNTLRQLGAKQLFMVVDEAECGKTEAADGILKHGDLSANYQGFQTLFPSGVFLPQADVLSRLISGASLWLMGLEGKRLPVAEKWVRELPTDIELVLHATNRMEWMDGANYLLPNVSSFEKSGSAVNALGRFQRVQASLPPQYTARDMHAVSFGLSRGKDRDRIPADSWKGVFTEQIGPRLTGEKLDFRKFDPMGMGIEKSREIEGDA